ncbi:MAG: tRNA uridine(34) 5-carboxymethylaminomethyl modification radical SAM/GNAT enzyme Elp3 [Candidatus Gracilibacteria bacterium]|nr:tRNA uridine(34) 5-carboxymethylaminomethyl modification radical SAM/GNAT enzyme Elp3 [Candidatus Gracilibacteria bacterium]
MDFSKIDVTTHQKIARMIVLEAIDRTFKNRDHFQKFRNKIIKREKGVIFHNLYFVKAYEDLVKEGKIEENEDFAGLIKKRSVRTMSGVAPVTVMTKPWPCPGKCTYCPTDVRMPKSYLPSQPAAQRGFRQRFDPYAQVYVRLKALEMTGHKVSKVELRILGGTWSSYKKQYRTWFVKRCLQAMNEYGRVRSEEFGVGSRERTVTNRIESRYGVDKVNTLMVKSIGGPSVCFDEVVKENETAKVRCIGVNIETRSDHIDVKEIQHLRRLGVTKIEMGVQTTDDKVQELTRRGHDLQSVKDATVLMKDAGFKLSFHMMPNLPGSTIELDKRMIGELFSDSAYQPDYLKIYPCVVIPRTSLAVQYRRGDYHPYDDETLFDILYENMKDIPEWCRVDRVARDIPADDIEAGFKISNIRQFLEQKLEKEGIPCRDIRTREIQNLSYEMSDVELVERVYASSGGKEFFLSYEDIQQDRLIALLRLRFPGKTFLKELSGAALIREVHVYGQQTAVGKSGKTKQHVGWGTKLMKDAEDLAKKAGYKKLAVIAGIGTREYYKKFGYRLEGTYMLKNI